MIDQIAFFFHTHWGPLEKALNSNGFIAVAGGFAGAWAGATAAQKIAEKNKSKDELLKEMRNTNAAIMTASAICESSMALKRQHVKLLKETFDGSKAALVEFLKQRNSGQLPRGAIFEFQVDFKMLFLLPLPVDILRQQMLEKLSLSSRALRLQIVLDQVANGLNTFIEKRNEFIEFYKSNPEARPISPEVYFGLRQEEGHINEDYLTLMEAITNYTDDVIQFSYFLCQDLMLHGEELAAKFKKYFRGYAPTIVEVDFAKAKDMMPDPGRYQDWTSSFVKKPVTKSRLRRSFETLRGKLKKLAFWRH